MTELSLNGKTEFPRTLWISAGLHHMTVALYTESQKPRTRIVFATVKLEDCYLALDKYASALWVGSAAFDVTEEEARQIRATFEPLGLHITEPHS
ncbi:MAG: hypothetical protein RB191_11515 [Terriglobia bacterium]|nr:hypothetical protein [Terriglobia bacterium]